MLDANKLILLHCRTIVMKHIKNGDIKKDWKVYVVQAKPNSGQNVYACSQNSGVFVVMVSTINQKYILKYNIPLQRMHFIT